MHEEYHQGWKVKKLIQINEVNLDRTQNSIYLWLQAVYN
jgi:hypothetical protein